MNPARTTKVAGSSCKFPSPDKKFRTTRSACLVHGWLNVKLGKGKNPHA